MKIYECREDAIKNLDKFKEKLDDLKLEFGIIQLIEESYCPWFYRIKFFDKNKNVREHYDY
jgi:hypothetical protein